MDEKKVDEIIKLLSMPKISVGVERTIQVAQYEPKKVSVFISQNAEMADPEKIKRMLQAAELQVNAQLKERL